MSKGKQNKNKGLGKGLSSLLGDSAALASLADTDSNTGGDRSGVDGAIMVSIAAIVPSPWQPRQRFDDAALGDLVASIKQHGVVQPLLVRRVPPNADTYELIAGERRWRAAQKAGIHALPVLVRDADDQMAAEIALVENIQRHDLSVVEEAIGYRRLMDEFGYTQEQLSRIVGKSRSHLANTMRLLNLPEEVLTMLAEGRVSGGQMRPLVGRDDAAVLARIVAAKGMSARQVEAMVTKHDRPKPAPSMPDGDLVAIEKKLAEKHGLKIAIAFNSKKGNGKITIACESLEQFDSMIDLLAGK